VFRARIHIILVVVVLWLLESYAYGGKSLPQSIFEWHSDQLTKVSAILAMGADGDIETDEVLTAELVILNTLQAGFHDLHIELLELYRSVTSIDIRQTDWCIVIEAFLDSIDNVDDLDQVFRLLFRIQFPNLQSMRVGIPDRWDLPLSNMDPMLAQYGSYERYLNEMVAIASRRLSTYDRQVFLEGSGGADEFWDLLTRLNDGVSDDQLFDDFTLSKDQYPTHVWEAIDKLERRMILGQQIEASNKRKTVANGHKVSSLLWVYYNIGGRVSLMDAVRRSRIHVALMKVQQELPFLGSERYYSPRSDLSRSPSSLDLDVITHITKALFPKETVRWRLTQINFILSLSRHGFFTNDTLIDIVSRINNRSPLDRDGAKRIAQDLHEGINQLDHRSKKIKAELGLYKHIERIHLPVSSLRRLATLPRRP